MPENMIIDSEDQPVDRVGKRRLEEQEEHEEREEGDPAKVRNIKKRRIIQRSDSALKRMATTFRRTQFGGQHVPPKTGPSGPTLAEGDKRERFTFITPAQYQQAVASKLAPLDHQRRYPVGRKETNAVPNSEPHDHLEMEGGSTGVVDHSLVQSASQALEELPREELSRVDPSGLGEGPSASRQLRLSVLGVGSTGTQEMDSDATIDSAISIGLARFTPADTVTRATSGLSVSPAEGTSPVEVNHEPTLPRDEASYDFTPLPVTSAAVSERPNALVYPDLQALQTIPTQSQGTPGANVADSFNPDAALQGRVRGVHQEGSDVSLPVRPTLSDDIPHRTLRGGQEPEAFDPDRPADQPPATTTDIMPPSVVDSTPQDSPESVDDRGQGGQRKPITATSSEADISDYLLRTSESLLDVTHVSHQAGGLAELDSDSQPTPQTAEESVSLTIEDPLPLAVEDSVASPAKGSVSPATEDQIAPIDGVPSPSSVEDPVASPVGDTIPQPSPHLHAVDTAMDTLNIVDTSGTLGAIRQTASLECQGQDEEDELIVDAILSVSTDLDTTSNLHCDITEPNEIPASQKRDENSICIPAHEEVVAAGLTGLELDLTPNPSNLAMDIPPPLATQRPQPDPILSQKSFTPATPYSPQNTDGVTAKAPPSMEGVTQESMTGAPDLRSVLNAHSLYEDTNVAGTPRELPMAKKGPQHTLVTPSHPPVSSFVDDSFDAVLSSPVVEGGSFWDLNVGATQDESPTDFVHTCITSLSSPTDTQGSEELSHSADQHRKVSLQQADMCKSQCDKPMGAPATEENVGPSATGSSDPSQRVSEQGSLRVIPSDTTSFGLLEDDHGSAGYRGGGARTTIADQPPGLMSTPAPGSRFQDQLGEPNDDQPADRSDYTLSDVNKLPIPHHGSAQLMQPLQIPGSPFDIHCASVSRPSDGIGKVQQRRPSVNPGLENDGRVSRIGAMRSTSGVRKPYARPKSRIPPRMYSSPKTPRSLATGAPRRDIRGLHGQSEKITHGSDAGNAAIQGNNQMSTGTSAIHPIIQGAVESPADTSSVLLRGAVQSMYHGESDSSGVETTLNPSSGAVQDNGSTVTSLGFGRPDSPSGTISPDDRVAATASSSCPQLPQDSDMDIDQPRPDIGSGDILPTSSFTANADLVRGSTMAVPSPLPSNSTADEHAASILNPNVARPAQELHTAGPVSTTPTVDPIPNQTGELSSSTVQETVARHHDGMTSNAIAGPSSGITQGTVSRRHDRSVYPMQNITTTPTSGQRRRSHPSHTRGSEIPEMLGEMKDVIGNLAASVNSLKDVVSDLRAGQNTPGGFGSIPTRGSRRGSGGRRGRGNRNGGRGGGSRSRSTGGPVGDDYVADDEDQWDEDEGEPKNYKLRDDVRKHAAFLLGTPKDGTLTNRVTPEEAKAYDPLCHEIPCTAENFRLHLEGTPAHAWNKAAVEVFAASFRNKYPHYAVDKTEDHFKVHLDTLIRKYKAQQLTKDNPDAKREADRNNRRKTRKASLLEERRKTVHSFPELQDHAWIIDTLGSAGMSSDESSDEHGVKTYRVKKKSWRAAELRPFLHAIDRVTEKIKNVTTSRGSRKTYRLPGNNVSPGGGIVPGLPVNFYDAAWLANLQTHMKPAFDSLKINHNVYPLVHDTIIQEIVLQNPELSGFVFN